MAKWTDFDSIYMGDVSAKVLHTVRYKNGGLAGFVISLVDKVLFVDEMNMSILAKIATFKHGVAIIKDKLVVTDINVISPDSCNAMQLYSWVADASLKRRLTRWFRGFSLFVDGITDGVADGAFDDAVRPWANDVYKNKDALSSYMRMLLSNYSFMSWYQSDFGKIFGVQKIGSNKSHKSETTDTKNLKLKLKSARDALKEANEDKEALLKTLKEKDDLISYLQKESWYEQVEPLKRENLEGTVTALRKLVADKDKEITKLRSDLQNIRNGQIRADAFIPYECLLGNNAYWLSMFTDYKELSLRGFKFFRDKPVKLYNILCWIREQISHWDILPCTYRNMLDSVGFSRDEHIDTLYLARSVRGNAAIEPTLVWVLLYDAYSRAVRFGLPIYDDVFMYGYSMRQWIDGQIQSRKTGCLGKEYEDLLNATMFDWDWHSHEDVLLELDWDYWYNLLQRAILSKKKISTETVIEGYCLGVWLVSQKQKFLAGKLEDVKYSLLVDLVSDFSEKDSYTKVMRFDEDYWDEFIRVYRESQENGVRFNKRVAYNGTAIGNHYNNIKTNLTLGKISFTYKMLSDIRELAKDGYAVASSTWQIGFSMYCKAKKNGVVILSDTLYDGFTLGKWVTSQIDKYMRGELDSFKYLALDTVGFDWKPLKSEKDLLWENMLALYKSCNALGVSIDTDTKIGNIDLGNWVRLQRGKHARGTLSSADFELLNSIGFSWK